MIQLNHIEFETKGRNEVVDITDNIRQIVDQSGISNGNALVFVPGATGGLSTIEYEPGLIKDFPARLASNSYFMRLAAASAKFCTEPVTGDQPCSRSCCTVDV